MFSFVFVLRTKLCSFLYSNMHTILFQLLVRFLWKCCFFAVFSWARSHFLTHKTKLLTVNSYHNTLFAQICLLWVEWLIYLTVGFFLRHVLRLSVFCILHILDRRSHRRHRRPGLALRLHGGPAGRRHRHHLRGSGHQCAGYVVVVPEQGKPCVGQQRHYLSTITRIRCFTKIIYFSYYCIPLFQYDSNFNNENTKLWLYEKIIYLNGLYLT